MTDAAVSPNTPSSRLLRLTSEISAAYLSNNATPPDQVAQVISVVGDALRGLDRGTLLQDERPQPAVPVRKSIQRDYLVCLEDGKKLKMLKRYLKARYAMTPEEYRARWDLPADYPMIAPNYAKLRSDFARKTGLGRKGSS
jgi:predicted transcriptional regulator